MPYQTLLIEKAMELKRQDVILRLQGAGHDLVANDICYHKKCMNVFKATQPKTSKKGLSGHDLAFLDLCNEIEDRLFQRSEGISLSSLRDHYTTLLGERGVKLESRVKCLALRKKISERYGSKVSFLDQTSSSGFVCSSSVPLGEALKMRIDIQKEGEGKEAKTLKQAGKIIRKDLEKVRAQQMQSPTLDVSKEAACELIPDSLKLFASSLLKSDVSNAELKPGDQVALASQIIMQQTGTVTPIGVGISYHLFNQTRSKTLVQLAHQVDIGISYECLQRQLTVSAATALQQIEADGVYVPESMTCLSVRIASHVCTGQHEEDH